MIACKGEGIKYPLVLILKKKMTQFNDFLNERLKDPNIKKEYDALEPVFAIIQAIIDARTE